MQPFRGLHCHPRQPFCHRLSGELDSLHRPIVQHLIHTGRQRQHQASIQSGLRTGLTDRRRGPDSASGPRMLFQGQGRRACRNDARPSFRKGHNSRQEGEIGDRTQQRCSIRRFRVSRTCRIQDRRSERKGHHNIGCRRYGLSHCEESDRKEHWHRLCFQPYI